MKKFLLSMAALAAFSFAQAEEVTVDFAAAKDQLPAKESEVPTDCTINGVDFSFVNCKGGVYQQASYLQVSGKNFVGNAYFTFSLDKNCSAIKVHTGTNASVNVSLTLWANGQEVETIKLDAKDTDFTYNIPADYQANGTEYKMGVPASCKYNAQLTSLILTVEDGTSTLKPADLKFSESNVELFLGDAFSKPELTKATTADVVYASSNDDVASVDANTGDVIIEGVGTAVITATAAANAEYNGGSASYSIKVIDPAAPYAILNGNFKTGNCGFTWEDGTLPEGLTYVWTIDKSYGYMKASAFKSNVAYAVEGAYLVTPVLDLSNYKDIKLSFETVVNFYADIEASKKECSLWVREEGGQWADQLQFSAWPEVLAWKPWVANEISLDAYKGKKIQIGWKYTCDGVKAGTWEVQNVLVNGIRDLSGVAAVEAEEAEAPVEFFNLQGVRVANPQGGLFIRRQGNKVEKVVIR